MAHVIGAGDRGQRLAVRAATERLAPLVGGQLRAPAEVDPAGLRASASLAGAGAEQSHLVWHTPEVDPPGVCGGVASDATGYAGFGV